MRSSRNLKVEVKEEDRKEKMNTWKEKARILKVLMYVLWGDLIVYVQSSVQDEFCSLNANREEVSFEKGNSGCKCKAKIGVRRRKYYGIGIDTISSRRVFNSPCSRGKEMLAKINTVLVRKDLQSKFC
ncbi:hypothetical protein Tco_0296058 [Tanacetum coccineum]